MSHRPLVFVSGLAVGDYLLWSWSLNGNHGVLALISGLTLPPLAVACLWLLALSVARLIARTARGPGGRLGRRGRDVDPGRGHVEPEHVVFERERETGASPVATEALASVGPAGPSDTPSRTLAA